MKKYQKYDVVTGQECIGDIQLNDVEFINSIICEVDISNNGNIAVDDVVFVLENGKIIKAIANNTYCNYQIGIVKFIDGINYTVQIDGIVEHSQTLINDMSKEVYATSNSDGRNLIDKLEAPFHNDDTAVIVGKKLSQNKIKLSPEFFVFEESEPNFLNDGLVAHYPLNEEFQFNDISGNNIHLTARNSPILVPDAFGNVNSAYEFSAVTDDSAVTSSNLPIGLTESFTLMIWGNKSFHNDWAGFGLFSNAGYQTGIHVTGTRALFANTPIVTAPIWDYSPTIPIGVWKLFTFFWDVATKKYSIYIDKTLIKNQIASYDLIGYNQKFGIANRNNSVITMNDGGIALNQGRIFNRIMTEKEIKRYFQYCNTWKVAL